MFGLTNLEIAACCTAGILAGGFVFGLGLPWLALATVILATAMALITLIDQRYFRIPNALSLPLIPLGLVVAQLLDPPQAGEHAVAALVGGGVFLAMHYAYKWYRGIDGLGIGDVKLMTAAGAWTGIDGMTPIVLLASIGALAGVAVSRLLFSRTTDTPVLRTRIPFGSFLAPAILGVWLLQLWL